MNPRLFTCLLLVVLATSSYAQVGIGTTTPKAFFNVPAKKTVLFGEDTTYAGDGLKLIWYGGLGAFRAGFVGDDFWNRTNVGFFSWAGGYNTLASGTSSVALGTGTRARGSYSFAMGRASEAIGEHCVAIGEVNAAKGWSTVAIGSQNFADGNTSVSMGKSCSATSYGSVALGAGAVSTNVGSVALGGSLASGYVALSSGHMATASGGGSTAMGYCVLASGNHSTALGSTVSTNDHEGSFILGDHQSEVYSNSADNQMMMRFRGGYKLYTTGYFSQTTAVGVQLEAGSNAWSVISDSARKENFRSVNGTNFLQKIARMRLGSWNYKGQDAKTYRHYGPMAQDFFAAFGHDELGTIGEDKTINQADFDGVNLIAIRALIKEVNQLKTELAQAKQREQATQARLDKIEALLLAQPTHATVSNR